MKYLCFRILLGTIVAACLLCAAPLPAQEHGDSRSVPSTSDTLQTGDHGLPTRLLLAIGLSRPMGAFAAPHSISYHSDRGGASTEGPALLAELQVPVSRVVHLTFGTGLTWNPSDDDYRRQGDQDGGNGTDGDGWYTVPLLAGLRLSTQVGGGVSFSFLGGLGACVLLPSPRSASSAYSDTQLEYGTGVAIAVSGGVGLTFAGRFALELRYFDGGEPPFEQRVRSPASEFVNRPTRPVSYTLILMGVRF